MFRNATEHLLARQHLLAELEWLDLLLQRQVLRLRAANLVTPDEMRGLYIPDALADALLREQKHGDAEDRQPALAEITEKIKARRAELDAAMAASVTRTAPLPLAKLAQIFSLSPFEVQVIVIALGTEVNLRYETLYAYAQNDVTKKRPTVDLALRMLCSSAEDSSELEEQIAHHAVFSAGGTLRRYQLVKLVPDPQDREPPLVGHFIQIEPRIVRFLLGDNDLDAHVMPWVESRAAVGELAQIGLDPELAAKLQRVIPALCEGQSALYFHGPNGVGKQSAAAAICAALEMPLLVVNMPDLLKSEQSPGWAAGLARREAMLQGAGLYLSRLDELYGQDPRGASEAAHWQRELQEFNGPLFVSGQTVPLPAGNWAGRPTLRFEFVLPGSPQRLHLWRQAFNGAGESAQAQAALETVANKFVLSPLQIRNAGSQALQSLRLDGSAAAVTPEILNSAARAQSDRTLARLAQKVEPFYTWQDIILPPRSLQQLRDVCAFLQYREIVYADWGFAGKLALGKGLKVLFAGASGTGKTMAAEIIANELALDLYKIDLSNVVSKYIGETEKNLAAIFREAQTSNAVLFFDEADALFGKRSEVKDAHDRYANIEVAYLLQKMEEYDGVMILATNLAKNLDEAFARRMHHTIEFPFPDALYRERIWRGMFPPQAPLAEGVDFGFFARQFELAGGSIRNIALGAAFLAAGDGRIIGMEHLVRATARELYKNGKLPSRADFREYYEFIRDAK